MTSGRSQMLATRNFRDWHAIIGEVTWSSVLKTTMDCHSKLVLHSLGNNQPVHTKEVVKAIYSESKLPAKVNSLNEGKPTGQCLGSDLLW